MSKEKTLSNKDKQRKWEKMKTPLFVIFCIMPFVLAFLGYFFYGREGESYYRFWNSVYASLELYALNPVYDMDSSNVLVYAGAICGILVDATVIVSLVFGTVFRAIHKVRVKFASSSAAIYSDNDYGKALAEEISNHGYLVSDLKKNRLEKTQNHIVLMDEDINALNFLVRHQEELIGKKMYLVLNQVDSALLDKSDANVLYLNKYELMARDYWSEHKYSLYDMRNEPVLKIAVIGYGPVGKAIFKYGYLNNIYNLNQSIEYHIWGPDKDDTDFLNGLLFTDTKDSIVVHEGKACEELKNIAGMDRVIIADDQQVLDLVQGMLWENSQAQIHVYSNENVDIQKMYSTRISNQLATFGDISEILTWENIVNEKLDRAGKLVNFDYAVSFPGDDQKELYSKENLDKNFEALMEEKWRNTDGYGRGSSLARADHLWIEKKLRQDFLEENILIDEEYFWKMEHARWCRFLYMNHWTGGPVRNNNKRIHHLLKRFDELDITDKVKDRFNNPRIRKELGYEPIKNVVFDIGKVLMFWDPRVSMELANEKYGDNLKYGRFSNEDMNSVLNSVFTDPKVWQQEDISLKNHEEMIAWLRENAGGQGHLADMCEQYYECAIDSAKDYEYASKWIQDLKRRGLNVYYLSNFGEESQKKALKKGEFKFLEYMDGGLFSYQIHEIKPGKEIYAELFNRYGLKAEQCIFVDDNEDNVWAARKIGMWSIKFEDYESANEEILNKTFY